MAFAVADQAPALAVDHLGGIIDGAGCRVALGIAIGDGDAEPGRRLGQAGGRRAVSGLGRGGDAGRADVVTAEDHFRRDQQMGARRRRLGHAADQQVEHGGLVGGTHRALIDGDPHGCPLPHRSQALPAFRLIT